MASPRLFDTPLLRRRLQRAATGGAATFLLERVAEDLVERLDAVTRNFTVATDLATPAATLTDALRGHPRIDRLFAARPIAGGDAAADVIADPEALPFAQSSLDLVVSALALQFTNDLPGALVQIRRALRPDGLFLAALIGGDTLTELRHAFAQAETETLGGVSPRVVPFVDVRTLGHLLQRAGFALPVTDVDRITVRYADALALMHDLRRMGAGNVLSERSRTPLRRATLFRLAEIYAERFADPDGRLRATFEVVWLSGWAPHESQQKPLKPGSAAARLADALGTTERPLPANGDGSGPHGE